MKKSMIKLLKVYAITVFILALPVGIILYLQWQYDFLNPDYVLPFASFFVTTIVGLAVIYTLKLTRDSLELTRATSRPFLNIYQFNVNWTRNDGQPTLVNNFIFGFCNTGAFPADQVSVLMKVNKEKMDNQQNLFVVSEGIPSICFPSGEIVNLHFREVREKAKLEVELQGKLKVRIEIQYKNKLTQETYKTIRSYLVQYFPTARSEPTQLPEEDYWD